MNIYSELAEFKTVKNLWMNMIQEGIQPDMYVMNSYLKACMKTRDTDQTCEVLQRFKDQGLRPLYSFLRQLHKSEGMPMRLWAHLQDFEFFHTKGFNKTYSQKFRDSRIEKRYTK